MVFRVSTSTDIEIPVTDISSFTFDKARKTQYGVDPDLPHNIDVNTGETLSFSQVEKMSFGIASGLQNKLGLKRGDVVATYVFREIYMNPVFHGVAMAQCSLMMSSPYFPQFETVRRFVETRPKVVFVDPNFVNQMEDIVKQANEKISSIENKDNGSTLSEKSDIKIILVRDAADKPDEGEQIGAEKSYRTLFDIMSSDPFDRLSIKTWKEMDETIAIIGYSSGSTGPPKGILVPHRVILACAVHDLAFHSELITKGLHKTNKSANTGVVTNLTTLPPIVVYSIYSLVAHLCMGHCLVSGFRMSVPFISRTIEKYQIDTFYTSPNTVEAMIDEWDVVSSHNTSSLMRVYSAGAPMPDSYDEHFVKNLGIRVNTLFGSSECLGVTLGLKDSPQDSVGHILPGLEAKVVDTYGKELGSGEPGELYIRSHTAFKGYLNNPEATAKAFDKEGYYRVGDIVTIKDDNHIYFHSRKSDVIFFASKTMVFPKGKCVTQCADFSNNFGIMDPDTMLDAEDLLIKHPLVKGCAVIGIPDKEHVWVSRAYVALSSGSKGSTKQSIVLDEIAEWANKQLDHPNKLYGGIEAVDEIPSNNAGKIHRYMLRNEWNRKNQ
ncbi:hypothetical protein H4219_004295 [Mycoemilia scoparia]|uniref:Acetyl-CoA synthetase-like protein n=1 Tax=Mycoemilia scoparia TaxID=417184 RepID=A0A9W8DS31_9FUNG|nr:hypothetical protein H4219_004295 [Mycoemilia scoparia]